MTTFDDRERAYEKKFMIDQELKFRAEARRDRQVARWAAGQLGLSGATAADYARSVCAEGVKRGGEGVFGKIRKDLRGAGVDISDTELRDVMVKFLLTAVREVTTATET
jgi:hypothetical protein